MLDLCDTKHPMKTENTEQYFMHSENHYHIHKIAECVTIEYLTSNYMSWNWQAAYKKKKKILELSRKNI